MKLDYRSSQTRPDGRFQILVDGIEVPCVIYADDAGRWVTCHDLDDDGHRYTTPDGRPGRIRFKADRAVEIRRLPDDQELPTELERAALMSVAKNGRLLYRTMEGDHFLIWEFTLEHGGKPHPYRECFCGETVLVEAWDEHIRSAVGTPKVPESGPESTLEPTPGDGRSTGGSTNAL